MRKFILLAISLLCVATVLGQSAEERVRIIGNRCDSIAGLLSEYRSEYARKESMREELAKKITKAESELRQYATQYDAAIKALSAEVGAMTYKVYVNAAASPRKEGERANEKSNTAEPLFTSNTKRNLIENDFFVGQLSSHDYKTLCDAQHAEQSAATLAAEYNKRHSELLDLQRRYMEVATPQEADSLSLLFKQKKSSIAQLDNELEKATSAFFFNKNYIYDLLMERGGHSALLDLSASLASSAEREINNNIGQYLSDALVCYHIRKRAIVDYELRIAELISAGNARNVLKSVANDLKNRDFRLSTLTLQRRSFIVYEPIEIKSTSFYNAKNPIPQTKVYDYGTVYRIRIGLFQKRPNVSALRGVTPLSCTNAYNNGLYAYFVGGFRTEQEAKEAAAELKRMGFKEPIIAVWVDGEFYPTLDAMRHSLNRYNIEISGVTSLADEVKACIVSHKSDCSISRIGSTFVIGTFDSKSAAQSIADEIGNIAPEANIKISKHQN